MCRKIAISLLLAAFGLAIGHSVGLASSPPPSPLIVRRVVQANQTAPIPTTTLFTPSQTGLYRVSAYMTQVAVGDGNTLSLNLGWSDDAGQEATSITTPPIVQYTNSVPPQAWGWNYENSPGNVITFEEKAGQPITYSVLYPSGGNLGSYSVYLVVERLM
jgi:hypothetical protein